MPAGVLQRELDAYRTQVSEHFGKTAEHFQAMGVQVRELYDHMAAGAESLCDPAKSEQAIAFSATEALQQRTAAVSEPEPEPTESVEAKEEIAVAPEPDAAVAKPEESSFTVTTPEEDDPDKRSYH